MAYSSATDVQHAAGGLANLIALSDYDANGSQDSAVIDAAIAQADALIDSFANKRYRVPFAATVPPVIVALSARIAVHVMRQQRQALIPGDLEQHALDIKWLEGLRDGDNVVGVEPAPIKSELQVDEAGERISTASVSREKLKGFW